jgi:hypothetical protein
MEMIVGSMNYSKLVMYSFIGVEAEKILCKEFRRKFEMKVESTGPSVQYIGGKMRQVELYIGVHAW